MVAPVPAEARAAVDPRCGLAGGQRYLSQRTNGAPESCWRFGRSGRTHGAPRCSTSCSAPPTYVTYEGERPIAITCRLQRPIPAEVFERSKVAAA